MKDHFPNRWQDIYDILKIVKNIPFREALQTKTFNFHLKNDPFMNEYSKDKLKKVIVIAEFFFKNLFCYNM